MNRKEAIEIVRMCCPRIANSECAFETAMRVLVPELKESKNESEDEKIRNALISVLKSDFDKDTTIFGITVETIIAWLEKQGEQRHHLAFKAEHGRYYYCIKNYFSGGKKQASKGDVVQALRGLPIMGLEDASEFFLPVNDMQLNKLNNAINHNGRPKFKVGDWIVYDKYNNKDIDRIVKFDNNIVKFESGTWLFNYQLNEDCKLWTIKDAEGGDVLSCENGWTCIFKALDNHTNTFSSYCFMDKKGWFCECGGQGHTLDDRICGEIHPATKKQRDLLFQKMKKAGYEWDAEQKELKKIETKFKVGDWVVTEEGKVNQVTTVSDDGDAYTLDDGTYFSGSWKDMYHLWTIEDAKEGDVLANKYGSVFIYAGFEDDKRVTVDNYCYITADHQEFCIEDHKTGSWYYVKDLNPATKEQRDLLFQKMKEAGYEWDAEKKELKKIEQKPVDEVETKFKVGNWYLCVKDFLGKGVRFDKGKAYHCGMDGCLQEFDSGAHICIDETLYDYFRLWTIQDAKDGDILCTYECDKPKIVFILKGTPNKHYALSYHCYYNIMYPHFAYDSEKGCLGPNEEDVKPATKEQRDLLFQKMGEEGYEWDAKNKILTKIEKVSTPKYKAGDWLICDDFDPIRVDCVDLKEQKYYLSNGDIRPCEMLDNNPYFRLWYIRNAKCGDILYNYKGNGVEAIHLVKGWENVEGTGRTLCSIATYRVLDNEVIKGGLGAIWWEGNPLEFRPATTEEKKKLFEKMKLLEKKQINWKPTKEQLRQLDAAVAAYAKGSKTHTELRSLSEDLKKIK